MKKVLFIKRGFAPFTGGELVSERNFKFLSEKFSSVYSVILQCENISEVKQKWPLLLDAFYKPSKSLSFIFSFYGYLGGLTPSISNKILNLIKKEKFDVVWLDTSLLGNLAQNIKIKISKNIKIITYFHNCEYDFNLHLLKTSKYIFYFPLILGSKIAEKKSIEYSDLIITISERDSNRLKHLYGRGADLILPVTLDKKVAFNYFSDKNKKKHGFILLFVGSLFYANYQGIKWFIENVMDEISNINIKLKIVGKGFEKYKNELERKNVDVLGTVENIYELYYTTDFFVSPIFYGSGMKVKTIEAIKYGLPIIGTKETFTGLENFIHEIGIECNKKEEFIYIMKNLNLYYENFDRNRIRKIFEQNFSNEFLYKKFSELMHSI